MNWPVNDVGLIKIRQADEQTQTLVVQITENGVPKSYEGLQVFFCAKLGQSTGLGIIEQKLNTSEMADPKNGKLEYTMRAEDWQILGRQTGYFSFRKMQENHEYTEQFTTRDFYFNITKNVFSDGVTEVKKDGSTYVWTIEDLIRLFNEYIASGKTDWEEFVEQNKEILESVDPGGKILAEINELTFVSKPVENFLITVGNVGDVSSLNEALKIAASRRAAYTGTGFKIEVRLLSGFVLKEQVFVKNQDLSFVTITAEDDVVKIDASSFKNNVSEEAYVTGLKLESAAAFTGYGIAKLPFVDCSFDFTRTGISGRTNGVFLIYGAEFRMGRGRKFLNGLSSGLSVMEGSKAYVTDTEFSGFNGNNIACYRGSYVLFRGGKANNSTSGYGVYLDNLCQMDAAMADFSDNQRTNVWISGQSLLSANNAKFNNSKTENGLAADGASVADVHYAKFNDNALNGIVCQKSSAIDANNCDAKNNNGTGILVSDSANVNASASILTGNGAYGVRCNFGGFLNISKADCRKVENIENADIRVDYGGYIAAHAAIGGLSGVAQGNVINNNGVVLNADKIPEDVGTVGTSIQSRVVFSSVKNDSVGSSVVPINYSDRKTIGLTTVAVHQSGNLTTDEIAMLKIEKYNDGFALTTNNSALANKLNGASAKVYFSAEI